MHQLVAPIAALFWVDAEEKGKSRIAVATRWTVEGPFSLELGPGVYAIFEPRRGMVSSTAFTRLRDFDNESYYVGLFSRIQDQSEGPVLCLGDVLVQPSEAKIAHCAEFLRLLSKESAA